MKYNNVYTVQEENSHRFYQMPKELFINEKYKQLNSDAKVLYTILLDRKELSRSNNWVDENDQVYLMYTRDNLSEMMGISKPTVIKAFKQLVKAGLIIEERTGLTKPNKIYICRLETSVDNGSKDFLPQEEKDFYPNDTDFSDTEERQKGLEQDSRLIMSFNEFVNNNEVKKEAIRVVEYYLGMYRQYMGKDHPRLKKGQWDRVVDSLLYVVDPNTIVDFDLDYYSHEDMINQHFITKYRDCDYNILHYVSEGVLVKRMYEVAY